MMDNRTCVTLSFVETFYVCIYQILSVTRKMSALDKKLRAYQKLLYSLLKILSSLYIHVFHACIMCVHALICCVCQRYVCEQLVIIACRFGGFSNGFLGNIFFHAKSIISHYLITAKTAVFLKGSHNVLLW